MSSPLDRIEAAVDGWHDRGTWRAFREDWFPETIQALVNVAKAALGPLGDGRMHMTSGELRCPECHDPAPWHHLPDCKYGEALAALGDSK